MPYPVAAVRGRSVGPTGANWWLAGGISAANCIAAYQPKGAANQAGSYVNLANPGTYDCSAPGNAPDWDAVNGWKFDHTNTEYLTTGITGHTEAWSMTARFSNVGSTGGLYGSIELACYLSCRPNGASGIRWMWDAALQDAAPGLVSGVVANAGPTCYRNGNNVDHVFGAAAFTGTAALEVGRITGIVTVYMTAYVQALAVYNTIITGPQAEALKDAMNAL